MDISSKSRLLLKNTRVRYGYSLVQKWMVLWSKKLCYKFVQLVSTFFVKCMESCLLNPVTLAPTKSPPTKQPVSNPTTSPTTKCLWENTGLPGHDISEWVPQLNNLPDYTSCFNACNQIKDCKTWTYVPEHKDCYVKTREYSTGDVWSRSGWFSGTKNCTSSFFLNLF